MLNSRMPPKPSTTASTTKATPMPLLRPAKARPPNTSKATTKATMLRPISLMKMP